MEISNGLNQPVSFYNKNTGNSVNTVINDDNHLYGSNFFASENVLKEEVKLVTRPIKKKRKSKMLKGPINRKLSGLLLVMFLVIWVCFVTAFAAVLRGL